MDSLLVAVDRQALPCWIAAQGQALVALEPEAGEHVRVARMAEPVRESPFTRFMMPVQLRFSTRNADADTFAQLAALSRDCGAGAVMILALRRHARLHAERFEAWRASRSWGGDTERVLCIALSDDEGYAGTSSEPGARLFPPGSWQIGTSAKLVDALRQLEVCGVTPRFAGTWIELGAFPGGMTRVLLERGARQVIAVDRNPPSEFLASEARVSYRRGEAATVELASSAAGLVCDVNGPAAEGLAAAARAAKGLEGGAVVVHTIKLRRWDDAEREIAQATADFAGVGVHRVAVRHLPANKQEIAWLGVKRSCLPAVRVEKLASGKSASIASTVSLMASGWTA